MRWPEGPPHLTLKPSKKHTQKNKKTKKKKQKRRRKKEPKKGKRGKLPKNELFIHQSFFPFLVGVQSFLFWYLGPKSAHPKNTMQIGVSACFLKSRCASRNGHFWTKKTKIQKFQLSFSFLPFSPFSTTKNTKISWNPDFYSVSANLKKRIFKKWT